MATVGRSDVLIALGLDPGSFSKDLAQAVRETQAFHQGAAGAADVDARAHEGLLGKMRDFRREQVQQGRMARFYAADLASIIPGAEGAKKAIQGVMAAGIEGLSGGLSFGFGFELIKTGLEFVVNAFEESKKRVEGALESWKASTAAVKGSIGEDLDEIRKAIDRVSMTTPAEIADRQAAVAREAAAKRQRELDAMRADLARPRQGETVAAWNSRRSSKESKEELRLMEDEARTWNARVRSIDDKARVERDAASIADSRELDAKKLSLAVEFSSDEKKIRQKAAAEVSELELKYFKSTEQGRLKLVTDQIQANADEEVRRSRENAEVKHAATMLQLRAGTMTKETLIAAQGAQREKELLNEIAQARRARDAEMARRKQEELAATRERTRLQAQQLERERQARENASGTMEEYSKNFEMPGVDEAGENNALRSLGDWRQHESDVRAVESSDLFRGTEAYAKKQADDIQEMYRQIDEWRGEDVTREATAQQLKSKVAAQQKELQLGYQREFWSTLATMQNSGVREIAAVGKAAAIAQATIDGILAVQKALASAPPPVNFALAAAVGAATAANVASIVATGFEGGGFTGYGARDKVAGVVHGQEFVSTAAATSRYRPMLEAMNAGTLPALLSAGSVGMRVTINNNAPGVQHEVRQVSPTEVEIVALIRAHAPRAVADDLHDLSGQTSTALRRSHKIEPRR